MPRPLLLLARALRSRRPATTPAPFFRRPGRAVAGALVVGALLGAGAIEQGGGSAAHAAAATTRGSWQVQALGGGRWQVRWTSPTLLPLTSDRPEVVAGGGTAVGTIGVPTVAADGRTVQAVITAAAEPRAADLDVVLSGVALDEVAPPAALLPRTQRAPQQLQQQRSTAPQAAGRFPVVSSDYTLPSVRIAGYAQPIEMVGHVVEPAADAATGPRPLVLLLHGRHSVCYLPNGDGGDDGTWPCRSPQREIPSQLGYEYLQRSLAGQGFTTVSIRVNGINAQDFAAADGGASARATIVAKHLDHWATIAAAHRVDLSRVVLIGHSRGGEGVDTAALRIPLSAPYRVVGEVLIAPTDFAGRSAPYVPTVTLLPYCDGDVSDLQGQQYTDTARDLADGDTALKSSVLILGANHNFFNTEWTPGTAVAPAGDDWYGEPTAACGTRTATRLTAAQQRDVAQRYVDAAVRRFTSAGGDRADLSLLDGSPTPAGSGVLSAAIGGGRDVRRPSADTTLSLASGADSGFCTGQTDPAYRPGVCGSELADTTAPHWTVAGSSEPTRTFWHMGWTAPGAVAGLQLRRPLDLRDRSLDLRTIVDPRVGDVRIRVRLTDATGHRAVVVPEGGELVPRLLTAPNVTKLWARDVRVVPPADGSIDPSTIAQVEVLGDSSRGGLWVADLAATPAEAPAAQAQRAVTVSLGERRQKEGRAPGTTVAEVPFTLSAPLTRAARFRVLTSGEQPGAVRRFSVDLAPGQTRGTIPVGYQANTLDDLTPDATTVTAWGQRDVVTDTANGRLLIDDDDPTPGVVIAPVKKTVQEGASARWRVTLAREVDYDLFVQGQVVAGRGHRLIGSDVPASWLRLHADPSRPSRPLDRMGASLFAELRKGSRTVVLSIPTARDGVREGAETVTLRVRALGRTSTSTVTVAPSR